jgi:hypothetical protein
MSPKQKKLAAKAPPPNKIDAKDFAVLKAEKAKGRGMGLQDESIKPGKVQKAFLGKMIKGAGKSVGRLFGKRKSATATPGDVTMSGPGKGMLPPLLQKALDDGIVKTANKGKMMKYKRGSGLDLPVISSVKPTVNKSKRAQNLSNMKIQFNKQRSRAGINPNSLKKILMKTKNPYSDLVKTTDAGPKKYSSMAEMRKAKGFKPGESASEFVKRRKELGAAGKALSATRIGKIALGVGTAGVAAQQYLKSKMNKKDEPKKKMGGGMMKKYSKGGGLDMGGPKAKIMQYIRDKKDDGQRLTMRDKEFIKSVMPKKMGGGMMKPMGYKSGTMVKARGCKLGRTRPTKIT